MWVVDEFYVLCLDVLGVVVVGLYDVDVEDFVVCFSDYFVDVVMVLCW